MVMMEPKKVKCPGCKQMVIESHLINFMGNMLCGFCVAENQNANHPEDARRDEWGL